MNWAEFGCPTQTGKPWSMSEMEEAIARGPHQLALTPEALEHFVAEIKEKVLSKQAQVVEWDAIKDNPPTELKISPIAAIPHKSKAYWLILANAIMEGIHDIFSPDNDNANDPISEKKLLKRDGQYNVLKTLLGFEFDGVGKILWLEAAKREKLLATLHAWIRMALHGHGGIPFKQFKITIAKLRHAFTAIPAGVGLLSQCTRVLAKKPPIVWLNYQKQVLAAIIGCRTLLRESTKDPT